MANDNPLFKGVFSRTSTAPRICSSIYGEKARDKTDINTEQAMRKIVSDHEQIKQVYTLQFNNIYSAFLTAHSDFVSWNLPLQLIRILPTNEANTNFPCFNSQWLFCKRLILFTTIEMICKLKYAAVM